MSLVYIGGKMKLSEQDVAEVRRMRAAGFSVEALAEMFDVSTSMIYKVARGERGFGEGPLTFGAPKVLRRDRWFEAAQRGMSWADAKQYAS